MFTRKLTEKLREAYAPLAEDCCKAILTTISSSIAELNSGTGTFFNGFLRVSFKRNNLLDADADVRSLAFLSRLTEALHASPFSSHLKCETFTGIGTSGNGISIQIALFSYNVKPDFHREISVLREQAVDQWREFVVTAVLADYQKGSRHVQSHSDCENPTADSFTLSNQTLHSTMSAILAPYASTLIAVFAYTLCGGTVGPLSIADPQHRHDNSWAFFQFPYRCTGEQPTSFGRTTRSAGRSLGLEVPSTASDFVDNGLGSFIRAGPINHQVAGM